MHFIIPDHAYSAGTIFCMSGDSILMDYYSVLGPIDPQVQNREGRFVPALGYLDKINELLKKAEKDEITRAEFIILKDFDLAELRGYEQARELTIELLKNWLVKYKFKNWTIHKTDPKLKGESVTEKEKEDRAKEIAGLLSNNKKWKSHSRPSILKDLKLEIDDYGKDETRRELIRSYHLLFSNYINRHNYKFFFHTRHYP